MGKRKTDPDGLTAQQEKFCQHYALHKNGSAAYRVGYPTSKKWDNQDVAVAASKLLAQPKIQQRITVLTVKVVAIADKRFDITVDRIMQELAAMAFHNIGDYMSWGTREVEKVDRKGQAYRTKEAYLDFKPSDELDAAQRKAVVGVERTLSKTGVPVVNIKLAGKESALKLLGQHLGMFSSKGDSAGTNVNVTVNGQPAPVPEIDEDVTDPKIAAKIFAAYRNSVMGKTQGNA